MNFTTILLNINGPVATITLNRPEKRNAISYQLIEELLAAMQHVEQSAAQVLILTGTGSAFCSGMDLEDLRHMLGRSAAQSLADAKTMAVLFRSLYEFPRPTIAAVNGHAIAGGTGLATLCDFTLSVPAAKFGYTEVKIGFVPAIVSTFVLRQVGEKIARDLLLTGRLISAEEALRIGLITEICTPPELMPRVQALAAQLLENSPASLRYTKKLLSDEGSAHLDRRIEIAVTANAEVRSTPDFREGITAFLEKRKPRWATNGSSESA